MDTFFRPISVCMRVAPQYTYIPVREGDGVEVEEGEGNGAKRTRCLCTYDIPETCTTTPRGSA